MTDIDPVTGGEVTWHPSPRQPDFTPPFGAVDAHCHVFGPAAEFPFAPERKYTPGEAGNCLLYTSPSPRDISGSRMPSSA